MEKSRKTNKSKIKVPKIKIPINDLKCFLIENLKIDPYWNDLYNPINKKNKYK